MSTATWKSPVNGSWWTAGNWLAGSVPQNGDDVVLGPGGKDFYSVTVDGSAGDFALASLTIGQHGRLEIDAPGAYSIATLDNGGAFQLGPVDQSLAGDVTVDIVHLTNSGGIELEGHAGNGPRAIVHLGDAAPSNLAGGSYMLEGNSLLEFAGGGIESTSSNALLWIGGPNAFMAVAGHANSNSALSHLSDNAGLIYLFGGARLGNQALAFENRDTGHYYIFDHSTAKTNLDFFNAGQLAIDLNLIGTGGARLIVAGTLHNEGDFSMGGNIDMVDPATAKVGALENTGVIGLGFYAPYNLVPCVLSVRGDATSSGTVYVNDSGVIDCAHTWTQTAGQTTVNGDMQASLIQIEGGVLKGLGTIESRIELSGGTISGVAYFGNFPATLSITGALIDKSAMDVALTAGGSGPACAAFAVDGRVVLKGATLNIHINDPQNLHAGETFDILDFAPGALRGHFASLTDGTHFGDAHHLDLGNGYALDAVYDNDAGHVQLVVTTVASEQPAAWHDLGLF